MRPHPRAAPPRALTLSLALCLALLATLAPPAAAAAARSSRYFHAAQCVARGPRCNDYFARRSGYACRAGLFGVMQTRWCVTVACKWCGLDVVKARTAPCTSPLLRARCKKPTPTPRPVRRSRSQRFYHAARCVVQGRGCSKYYATTSQACRANTAVNDQPKWCVTSACRWCNLDMKKRYAWPCQKPVLKSRCYKTDATKPKPSTSKTPKQTTTTKPTTTSASTKPRADGEPVLDIQSFAQTPPPSTGRPSPSPAAPAHRGGWQPARRAGACTWKGNDQVVISLGDVIPGAGWEPTRRDGFRGLVFRPDWGLGLAKPHLGGTMCFPVEVRQSGDYFLTFVSYAPHRTEHNDAWIASRDRPFKLWKTDGARSFSQAAGAFMKAYQGNGAMGGMSAEMKTGDHDGHRFVVLDVRAGKRFRICLSGRSFRFSVFRLVLKKCFANVCEGGGIFRKRIYDMPVSRCE